MLSDKFLLHEKNFLWCKHFTDGIDSVDMFLGARIKQYFGGSNGSWDIPSQSKN